MTCRKNTSKSFPPLKVPPSNLVSHSPPYVDPSPMCSFVQYVINQNTFPLPQNSYLMFHVRNDSLCILSRAKAIEASGSQARPLKEPWAGSQDPGGWLGHSCSLAAGSLAAGH